MRSLMLFKTDVGERRIKWATWLFSISDPLFALFARNTFVHNLLINLNKHKTIKKNQSHTLKIIKPIKKTNKNVFSNWNKHRQCIFLRILEMIF